MPTYEYTCKRCGAVYNSHETKADRLDKCATKDCDGIPRRVWTTALLRENLRAR